jgi:type IV pilus assembly protein PilA
MIVVAIIGILAAIALPAYQDYTTRSKVSELVVAADNCKTSVTEYYTSQGSLPADETIAGCSKQTTQYVTSLTVASGVITVASAISNATGNFVLTPVANGTNSAILDWSCKSSTLSAKFLPANCR